VVPCRSPMRSSDRPLWVKSCCTAAQLIWALGSNASVMASGLELSWPGLSRPSRLPASPGRRRSGHARAGGHPREKAKGNMVNAVR
jgi:hypothetical protein